MAVAKEWETKYGMAIRNDQMEGYLKKKIQNPFYPRLWHEKYAVLTRLEVCNDISVTVPVLLLDPEKPRDRRVVQLNEMLETRCTGGSQFVIDMPDRQWLLKARNSAEAAVWVAGIIDTQSSDTWYVDWIVLKTAIFTWRDDHPTVVPEKVDNEVVKTLTLQLHPLYGIIIRDVLSGKEKARLSYDDIHSFEANRCLFWITTCVCGSVPASLHFFLVTTGETACLTLLKELKQCIMLYSKQSHQSTLLPSEVEARHVATVTVDRHAHCVFPRHLDPLKIGRKLSEGVLPLSVGVSDHLCITRRTGNSALMCANVARDYTEKYAPKGAYPRMHCTASDVYAPPVVLPQRLPICEETRQAASSTCQSPTSVVSYSRLCTFPSGIASHPAGHSGIGIYAARSEAMEPYVSLAAADPSTYLELLSEVEPLSLGAPDQLLTDGALSDTSEAETLEDKGDDAIHGNGSKQDEPGHVLAAISTTGRPVSSTSQQIKETLLATHGHWQDDIH